MTLDEYCETEEWAQIESLFEHRLRQMAEASEERFLESVPALAQSWSSHWLKKEPTGKLKVDVLRNIVLVAAYSAALESAAKHSNQPGFALAELAFELGMVVGSEGEKVVVTQRNQNKKRPLIYWQRVIYDYCDILTFEPVIKQLEWLSSDDYPDILEFELSIDREAEKLTVWSPRVLKSGSAPLVTSFKTIKNTLPKLRAKRAAEAAKPSNPT